MAPQPYETFLSFLMKSGRVSFFFLVGFGDTSYFLRVWANLNCDIQNVNKHHLNSIKKYVL